MVDTRRGSGRCHLFLHWVFYWRVFPRCSAAPLSAGRDLDLVTPPVTLLATRLLRQHQHRPLPLTNYTSLTPVLVSTSL